MSPLFNGCRVLLLDFFVQSSHILNGNNGMDFFVAEAAPVNGRWREGAAVTVMEGLGMMRWRPVRGCCARGCWWPLRYLWHLGWARAWAQVRLDLTFSKNFRPKPGLKFSFIFGPSSDRDMARPNSSPSEGGFESPMNNFDYKLTYRMIVPSCNSMKNIIYYVI